MTPDRPDTSDVVRHRTVLGLTIGALLMSFAMVERPDGRVAPRGLPGHPLPTACASRSLLGIRCPGCGLTRSFLRLARGDWRGSWRCHRLGGLLAALVAVQIPYRIVALRRPGAIRIPTRWQAAIVATLIALLIVNWLAEVVSGRLSPL